MAEKVVINEHVSALYISENNLLYQRTNPTAGMTESQATTYNKIPGSEQERFREGVFKGRYPDNYLKFTASDSANQETMDFITLYNKVNFDPAYLNSLSSSDFQSLMNEYVDTVGERVEAMKAGCYTMTDAEFNAADPETRKKECTKSQLIVDEWNSKLVANKKMFGLYAPDQAAAVQNGVETTRDAVSKLFPSVAMHDDGTFYCVDYNVGLTAEQIASMNTIKHGASQDAYRKAQLGYPSDYLNVKSPDPELQAEFDRISLYEKLNNEAYLTTLSRDELQALVEKGLSEYNAHGAEFDDVVVAAWINCATDGKSSEELVKLDLVQYLDPKYADMTPEAKRDLLEEVRANPDLTFGSAVDDDKDKDKEGTAAPQNGTDEPSSGSFFSDMKERVTSFFGVVKDLVASTTVGAWIIEKGEALYDKVFGDDEKDKVEATPTSESEPSSEKPEETPNKAERGSEFDDYAGASTAGHVDVDVDADLF